ncbi:type II toxin-antitoxin system RnlB family antitoxin [Limosilactobacillus reuteri]|uniref:type II toxin-antitoxin system RnlB family antitoxin n=1 Tax=Limosilactobacillus reuteri TaxID=1598 RepID=UPI0039BF8352
MQKVIFNTSRNQVLVTLLDSYMPQSIIIKNLKLDKDINEVLVDTVVRNRITDRRFMELKVINGNTEWKSRRYISPAKEIVDIADNILSHHTKELENSFLTKREINRLIKK